MRIRTEALWILISTGIGGLSQLTIYALLSRSASAEVIGQLAIINVALGIAFLLQDMGLSSYYIHRQSISAEQRSTLFAVNTAFGIISALVLAISSVPIGSFYESDAIANGLILISLNFFFLGVSAQYQASYIKYLKNDKLAKIEIFSKLCVLSVSAFLIVYFNMGLTGYLYSILLASAVKFFLLLGFAEKSWHPKLKFDKQVIRPALNFGVYQLGSQVINQLRTQADQLIIGKSLGVESLGVYALAKELVMQPTKFVGPMVSKLLMPRFAMLQSNMDEYNRYFDKARLILCSVNTFIYLSLAIFSYFLIPVVFGDEYSIAIEILMIILLVGLLRPVGSLFGALSQSKGKSNVEFFWNGFASVISLSILLVAAYIGTIYAFAIAMAVTQLILSLVSGPFFSRNLVGLNIGSHIIIIVSITGIYGAVLSVFYATM
ncbi:hypothetical protein DU002_11095 [Corallincola holothuriorum]|uniref:Polysaccharide biosynthesis protein n=1 Tax=Corallincola holothuriorum TaxID=2282215 RepID=A0A368NFX8_9GAMM|nr:oligosaccharide flippase family protein [Corallincola holothuriorum]RCU49462.1 hypothetical protein DU002_11095 [Corallincola holothuriorum]